MLPEMACSFLSGGAVPHALPRDAQWLHSGQAAPFFTHSFIFAANSL